MELWVDYDLQNSGGKAMADKDFHFWKVAAQLHSTEKEFKQVGSKFLVLSSYFLFLLRS